jgi:hypothetical protein
VPEYGRNRFLVVAGEIEGETRRIVLNRRFRSILFFSRMFGFAGRIFDPKFETSDPVYDPVSGTRVFYFSLENPNVFSFSVAFFTAN